MPACMQRSPVRRQQKTTDKRDTAQESMKLQAKPAHTVHAGATVLCQSQHTAGPSSSLSDCCRPSIASACIAWLGVCPNCCRGGAGFDVRGGATAVSPSVLAGDVEVPPPPVPPAPRPPPPPPATAACELPELVKGFWGGSAFCDVLLGGAGAASLGCNRWSSASLTTECTS